MIAGGFCRNCLGDWYRDAAADKGIALEKAEARTLVYGMPRVAFEEGAVVEQAPLEAIAARLANALVRLKNAA